MKTEEATKNAPARVKVMKCTSTTKTFCVAFKATIGRTPCSIATRRIMARSLTERRFPPFTEECHLDLAKILAKVHGKWLLTYNDHPRIRKLYRDFKISEVVTRLNTDKSATANPPRSGS
jgi:hypothetical protein